MRVTSAPGYFDAALIQVAGLLDPAELLEDLSSVKICGRVILVMLQNGVVFLHSLLEFAALDILHRETITRERISRVLREHRSQCFHSVDCHPTCYYTRV